ncbi:MAG: ABC transporter ATP-binding protein [Candidatus Margulisiibacteriota bacterium]
MTKASAVSLSGISKCFGSFQVLKNVDLHIRKGEFFSLLGPSGCGKTTLLRMIAGFEIPDSGTISLDESPIGHLAPNQRPVNTIFQTYALFPHLSVFENVAFSARLKKMNNAEVSDRVGHYLNLVKLFDHRHKSPAQLSGGQRQRVAIARALTGEPSVLLLDEPLSALDAKLRQQLLIELDMIHDAVGITFIYVTHDQSEALGVSDRIAIMNEGHILQVGSSHEIYNHPANSFVANFIGETNLLEATVTALPKPDLVTVEISGFEPMDLPLSTPVKVGQSLQLSLRPEKIMVSKAPPNKKDSFITVQGVVNEIVYSGYQSRLFVKTDSGFVLRALQAHDLANESWANIQWNDSVYASWKAESLYTVMA